jgi:hypothetical protein
MDKITTDERDPTGILFKYVAWKHHHPSRQNAAIRHMQNVTYI